MRTRTTLMLLILCVIIGVGFFVTGAWQDGPGVDTTQIATGDGEPLLTADMFAVEDITGITIDRGNTRISIERRGDRWLQTQPVLYDMSPPSVGALVGAITQLRYVEVLGGDPPANVESLLAGDSAASVTLHFDGEGGSVKRSPITLALGDRLAVGGRAYIALNGKAYVVNDALHGKVFDQSADDWRSRTFDTPREGRAGTLTITTDDHSVTVTKQTGGQWMLASPDVGRASRDDVSRLLDGLGGMTIASFVADAPSDLSAYGLDKPQLRVHVAASDPSGSDAASTLLVGSATDLKAESFFATWSRDSDPPDAGRVIVSLHKAQIERFFVTADDLRDRRPVAADLRNVNRFNVLDADGKPLYQLTRTIDGWGFTADTQTFNADADMVGAIVKQFVEAEAVRFVAADQVVSDHYATVEIGVIGQAGMQQYRVVPAPVMGTGDIESAIIPAGSQLAYVMSLGVPGTALRPAVMLRDRLVFDAQPRDVTSVAIIHPDGAAMTFKRDVTADGTPGDWSSASGDAFDAAAVNALVKAVAPLRAESWDMSHLDFDGTRVRVETRDNRTLDFRLTTEASIVAVEGISTHARISSALAEAANAEFRDKLIIPLAVRDVTAVAVQDAGGSLQTVTRRASDRYTFEGGAVANTRVAAALFDAVAGLSAVRLRDDAAISPEHVARTITLSPREDTQLTIVIARPVDDIRMVRVSGTLSGKPIAKTFTVDQLVYIKLTGKLSN